MQKGLDSFQNSLFSKKGMKQTVGGRMASLISEAEGFTKTNCSGKTTTLPDCKVVQDCGDSDNID